MNSLKVAIILPVYNVASYLRECLDSILSQEYDNFIVIAVNDGSTDDSRGILESYAKKDSRIIVLDQENSGISSVRNRALELIESMKDIDYVSFIDSDDTVDVRFLSRHISVLKTEDADVSVCGYTQRTTETQKKPKTFNHKKILSRKDFINMIYRFSDWKRVHGDGGMIWKQVYKASIIQGLRFIDDEFFVEDEFYNLQVAKIAQKFVYIPENLYFYRNVPTSLTNQDKFLIKLMNGRRKCYELCPEFPLEQQLTILSAFIEVVILVLKTGHHVIDIKKYQNECQMAYKAGMLRGKTYRRFLCYCHFPTLMMLVFRVRKFLRKIKGKSVKNI